MIKQEIQCTACGTSNELGSIFCIECGVTLKVETANFVTTKKTKSRRACITCGTTACDHQQTNDKYDYCCLDLPLEYNTKPWDCKGCGVIDGNPKEGWDLNIPVDETDITIVDTLKKGIDNLKNHNPNLVYKPPKNHQGLKEDLVSEMERHRGNPHYMPILPYPQKRNEDDYIDVYNYQSPVPKRVPIQKPITDRVPAPLKPLKKGSELTLMDLKNEFAKEGMYYGEMKKATTDFAESIQKNMKYKLWGTFLSMSIALTIIIEGFL